jgi:hypothetical protein
VRLTPVGDIHLSRYTWEMLGCPDQVNVLFDRGSQTIAIVPCDHRDTAKFECTVYNKNGGRQVRALSLVEDFGVSIADTIRFKGPKMEDGKLVCEMANSAPLFHGPRKWASLAERNDEKARRARVRRMIERAAREAARRADQSYTPPKGHRSGGFDY